MFKLVVLSSLMALVAANPSAIAPLGWAGHGIAAPLISPWAGHLAPLAHGGVALAAAPVLGAYNYRGPLSLAPGQPANILAADGRPLDTLSVNLDRAAHLTARAIDHHAGLHILKKRSAPLLAAPGLVWPHAALPARLIAPVPLPLAHALPLGWPAPIAPLGLGPWGHARLGHHW